MPHNPDREFLVAGLIATLVAVGLLVVLPGAEATVLGKTENFYEVTEIPARETDTSQWDQLDLGEEDSQRLSIPPTPFFDDVVEEATVTSEGFMALGPYDGPVETQVSGPIPASDGIDGILAPVWSGLDPSKCGDIRYQATPDRLRVAFEDIVYEGERTCLLQPLADRADRVSAWTQVNVGNGTIEIHLLRADGGPTTTTGVEAPPGDVGNQTYRTERPLRDPVAWRFELRSPEDPDRDLDPLPQDDAGTGGDAPDDPENGIDQSFTTWTGTLDAPFHDDRDWYRVDAEEGDVLTAEVDLEAGLSVQAAILDPEGTALATAKVGEGENLSLSMTAEETATYAIGVVTFDEGARGNYTIGADRLPAEETDQLEEPHVVVGVPDTGINPYHETYYRADLTAHPCTYVPGYPCDIPALPLSVEEDDREKALAQDQDVWNNVEPGEWYWIPKTNLIAVSCETENTGSCILGGSHGTETTSSVLSENPNALIAFQEGGADHLPFIERGLPVDIFSVSWGHLVPQPVPAGLCDRTWDYKDGEGEPLYVNSAGNLPWSTLTDCWAGLPNTVTVGGAYAEPPTEETSATKQPDVVSYYCRPVAKATKTSGTTRNCGTSFAAPTVAGALSRVVLELRESSGYTGSVVDGVVDPRLDIDILDLRDSLNRTATYDPDPRYISEPSRPFPLLEPAPWLQWGWGFYDGWVANDTVDDLLGVDEAPEKPAPARTYMNAVQTTKATVYGDSVDAGS